MDQPYDRNADQVANWNGASGRRWTEQQEYIDAVLSPVSEAIFDCARLAPGMRVLDIGCGCGGTTLALASRVAPGGHVLGVDVSAQMLARARERTPPSAAVAFVEADATIYAFEPACADLLFSRFGVMFFAEPVRSFANMRRGLRRGADVALACWREAYRNPWVMLPLEVAVRFAPLQPDADPDAPGPFSFASERKVRAVLNEAGFAEIAMHPIDLLLDVAVGRGLEAAVEGTFEIGPAGRLLDNQPVDVRAAAARAIRTALTPFQRGQTVPMGGAIWVVTATNH